jgi:predicted metal-dependent hydrolase
VNRSQKKTYLDGVGEINIRRSSASRFIRIRIEPDEGVILTIPVNIAEKEALRFAYDKRSWIRKSLARRETVKNHMTVFNETSCFKTRHHGLFIEKHAKSTIKSMVHLDRITVWYPDFAEIKDPRIQRVIRKAVEEAWRIEAKNFLPRRIDELASKFNFHYERLSIKNAKTRWGSCSAHNNINLNLQLMRLPDFLIDYVILHELVHTVEKNHKKSFWNKLESIMPGAGKFDKELNKFNLKYW